jgi:hypothetical protein
MAGLVSGKVGLAKAVTVHSVKLFAAPPDTRLPAAKAFLWIINEVITTGIQGKAVINYSLGTLYSASLQGIATY